MGNKRNLLNRSFGRWTVLSESEKRSSGGSVMWNCRCQCGTVKEVLGKSLLDGASTSCGCYNRDIITKHGHASNRTRTLVYRVWSSMHERCYSNKHPHFNRYGGRGITVCERWSGDHGFENFFQDMGDSNGLTLDRIDNNGDYSKENCRWATRITQARNRKGNVYVELDGRTITFAEAVVKMNTSGRCRYQFSHMRKLYKLGMSFKQIEEHSKRGYK